MKEKNERNVRDSIKKYQDKIEKMKMEIMVYILLIVYNVIIIKNVENVKKILI